MRIFLVSGLVERNGERVFERRQGSTDSTPWDYCVSAHLRRWRGRDVHIRRTPREYSLRSLPCADTQMERQRTRERDSKKDAVIAEGISKKKIPRVCQGE